MRNSITSLHDGVTAAVSRALCGLRFGSVEITVHDGRVVQIERREKVRLEADDRGPNPRTRNDDPNDRTHRTAGGAASAFERERSS